MATFPKKESDILAMAQEMADVYPDPIVSPDALEAGIKDYMEAKNEELKARSAWERAVAATL